MEEEAKASDLLKRVINGERSRELVEELDALQTTNSDQARQTATIGLYKIIADAPELFVEDYTALLSDLYAADEATREGAKITFSWLAENPPSQIREYVDPQILKLLQHEDDLIRGTACQMLSRLALDYPSYIESAIIGLRALLDDSNPQIRGQACLTLGRLQDNKSIQKIKQLQIDPSQYVRELASEAINQIQTEEQEDKGFKQWQKADLLEYDSREFEELIGDLWREMGYSTQVTPPVKDGGYDVEAQNDEERILIEAKRHEAPVGVNVVREAAGLLEFENADRVTVVTSSRFTRTAETSERVELIDGEQLCDLLTVHGFSI
jgi:HJR/Mrr/RecB family endonuclease